MQTTMLFLALILAGCAPAATPAPVIVPDPTGVVIVTQLDTPTILIILSGADERETKRDE